MSIDAKRVTSNIFWRFAERSGAHIVSFIVSVILARLLDPVVYGTVAIVSVFIAIMQVFIDGGMGNALIQKKDADDLDFSSVFYFNMVACVIAYFLVFIFSPFIALFYDRPELTRIIRVLSLTLIVSGVKNIQQAYVSRCMIFKRFFFATLGGTISAALVGIYMAWHGCGVWALVAQHLVNVVVDTIILWVIVKWRPKRMFSLFRLKELFSYGWKLLVSSLIDVGYKNLRTLIIGKLYTSEDLAFYNRGVQFPELLVNNINTAIDSVLLPTMSSVQDKKMRVHSMTRRAIKTSSFIMMPLMMGLAVCSEPMVRLLLTEKWIPCVFFLRIFCFTYAFYPIHTANLNAIKAMGRSDLFLRIEIFKKVMSLSILAVTMFISVKAMALSAIVSSIIQQIINSWPNRKLLDYHYSEQIKDIMPQIILSCVMGIIIYCISFLGINDLLTIMIQIPLGAAVYIVGSKLFHIDSFGYIWDIVKSYIRKRKTETEEQ